MTITFRGAFIRAASSIANPALGCGLVPETKEKEYQRVAEEAVLPCRGYLPGGASLESPGAGGSGGTGIFKGESFIPPRAQSEEVLSRLQAALKKRVTNSAEETDRVQSWLKEKSSSAIPPG